jgi:hypothetical protein
MLNLGDQWRSFLFHARFGIELFQELDGWLAVDKHRTGCLQPAPGAWHEMSCKQCDAALDLRQLFSGIGVGCRIGRPAAQPRPAFAHTVSAVGGEMPSACVASAAGCSDLRATLQRGVEVRPKALD